MKRFLFSILAALVSLHIVCAESVINKSTVVYAVHDDVDTLKMDVYKPANNEVNRKSMIFAFGGGFSGGQRDADHYMQYFEYMVNQGYVVFSIDYRLGLKDVPVTTLEAYVPKLANAITMAVEDFITATAYVVQNKDTFGIDPNGIIACGSSAGAITSLQSEYLIANGNPLVTTVLPTGFNYAGVVSFAGALCSIGESPRFAVKPCPMMLWHGDADDTVPFNALEIPGVAGLYGSQYISNTLIEAGAPHCLYVMEGANHSVASSPMTDNLDEISDFLRTFVDKKSQRIEVMHQITPGAPRNYKKDFAITDFLH